MLQSSPAVLLAVLGFAAWATLVALWALSRGLGLSLYLLVNFIVFVDAVDLMVRVVLYQWRTRGDPPNRGPISLSLEVGTFTAYQMALHLRPYALLVSVNNAADELDDFLEAMQPYRDRLWVIDDGSSDDTWFRLQEAGLHCVRGSVNRRKPGAIRELLRQLPSEIVTVIVLDPDIRILDRGKQPISDLERVIFEFQCSGKSAACPCIAVKPDGWLARLQVFEYRMAFALGRRSLADYSVTSGVAIYRRDDLEQALARHNLSVYAEDLRNAFILLARGSAIYYDGRLVVETDAKRTWATWFSQRVGWAYGLVTVYTEHFRELARGTRGRLFFAYQYLVYLGVFTLLLHPLRVLGVMVLALSTVNGLDYLLGLQWIPDVPATAPLLFLTAYIKYTALALLASLLVATSRKDWLQLLPAVPVYFFYAAIHTLPVTLGYLNWISLGLGGGRLYRDHYQDERSVREIARNGQR
jgi:cellulose synthase/poly-beta-1,6-N-acetylglucosamine synthase-like glycosyltransferase